jgi:hypothetical protein
LKHQDEEYFGGLREAILQHHGYCCRVCGASGRRKRSIVVRPEELQAIVADYFDMLSADLSGKPYVKARHRAVLVDRFGCSNGSINLKYQNISAVLDELGAQWIPG